MDAYTKKESPANAGTQLAGSLNEGWQRDFGTTSQAPLLVVDFNGDGRATWQEFGQTR